MVEFVPQRLYLATLISGLAVLGLVLLAGAITLLRSRVGRRRGPTPTPAPARSRRRFEVVGGRRRTGVGQVALLGVAGVSGWLVGGPVVAAGVLLGVALRRRFEVVQVVGTVALVGAVVVHVVALLDRPQPPSTGVDLVTGFGVALLLASGLAAPRAGARPG